VCTVLVLWWHYADSEARSAGFRLPAHNDCPLGYSVYATSQLKGDAGMRVYLPDEFGETLASILLCAPIAIMTSNSGAGNPPGVGHLA
jgi:hypothetical protein